jgi:hypothetical protein
MRIFLYILPFSCFGSLREDLFPLSFSHSLLDYQGRVFKNHLNAQAGQFSLQNTFSVSSFALLLVWRSFDALIQSMRHI